MENVLKKETQKVEGKKEVVDIFCIFWKSGPRHICSFVQSTKLDASWITEVVVVWFVVIIILWLVDQLVLLASWKKMKEAVEHGMYLWN